MGLLFTKTIYLLTYTMGLLLPFFNKPEYVQEITERFISLTKTGEIISEPCLKTKFGVATVT